MKKKNESDGVVWSPMKNAHPESTENTMETEIRTEDFRQLTPERPELKRATYKRPGGRRKSRK